MDNYTMIPNDLLEAIYSYRLSPLHMQIMLYVIRKTYGFHKETDFITITKLASDLGRYRQDVSEAVRELEGMGCLGPRMSGLPSGKPDMSGKHFMKGIPDAACREIPTKSVGKTRHTKERKKLIKRKQ